MDVTTQRRCLGTIAAGLDAGPMADASARQWSSPVERKTQPEAVTDDPSLAARPLRRPLYDPPPKPPAPKPVVAETPAPPPSSPPPQAKLDVVLVGTIIQPEQSLAIIADAAGEFDVKGVGESLELTPQGITIATIESERVTLLYQGRPTMIEIDRKQPQDEANAGNRGGNRRRNNR